MSANARNGSNGAGNRKAAGTAKRPPVSNGNGRRRTTGGYRAQRGGGGGKGVLFVVLVLVAAGIGAGWAFKDDILGRVKPKPPDTTSPVTPTPVTPTPITPTPVTPTPVTPTPITPTPVTPIPATPDNDAAARAIADGQRLMAGLNYGPALQAFGKVEGMKCSADLSKQAQALTRKVNTLNKLSSEVKVRPDAGENIQILVLNDGREIKGVVSENSDGSYKVLVGTKAGGSMRIDVPRSEIAKIKIVDPKERIADLKGQVAKLVARLGAAPGPANLVDVAVYALENGLKKDGHDLLGRAWDDAEKVRGGGTNGKDLLALVSEHRAGKLFAQADWYDSVSQEIWARTYCQKILDHQDYNKTSFADAARKLLAMMDERKGIKNYKVTYKIEAPKAPIKPPDPIKIKPIEPMETRPAAAPKVHVSSISSSGTDLGDANSLFREGLTYYSKGMSLRGTSESKVWLSKAGRNFRKAGEIYERALKSDPGNSSLESRVVDCNKFRYACMKHSTL